MAYISADSNFYIQDGQPVTFKADTVKIYCFPTYDPQNDTCSVDVRVHIDGGEQVAGVRLEFTKAELTAFTASGADNVLKFQNLVEQAVDDYLETLADNSSVTFTIT
ncbi:MAG TPA: hypothetical protein PKW36_08530 [bacterium]|nr:hypothetical protein [bacterium]